MTTNTITEADVVAFLTERAKEVSAEFGGYGSVRAYLFIASNGEANCQWAVGAGGLTDVYNGDTIAASIKGARKSPEALAAKKRAEAARLLAEADKLEGEPL
jgi:hypothetical protein